MSGLPQRFDSVEALEDFMSEPTPGLVADLARVDGDIMVIGVGGKMGPTLARMAKRAAPGKRVIGVARFSDPQARAMLEAHGVECIACDLLDREAVLKLPNVAYGVRNVVFMAGHKFGAADNASLTWMMNVGVPAMVADIFRETRIVSFSTACVYPFDHRRDNAQGRPQLQKAPLIRQRFADGPRHILVYSLGHTLRQV